MKDFVVKSRVLIVLLSVVLLGCTTVDRNNAEVFDPSVPEEETCFLSVPNFIQVKEFNSTAVFWQGTALSLQAKVIRIPAGNHTLIIDYTNPFEKKDYKDVTLVYDFEVGRTYLMDLQLGGEIVFKILE